MEGPYYEPIVKDGSGTDISSNSATSNLLYCGRDVASPKLSFAYLIDDGETEQVQIGNFVTSNGLGRDISYGNFPSSRGDADYVYETPGLNIFCVEQKIAIEYLTQQYGTTLFVEYEKLKVLGFIDDNDSPNYELKDTLEVEFSSGGSTATINFQVVDNKIRIDSDVFPRVPTQQNPVTIKFICELDFSSDDYNKIIVQAMSTANKGTGNRYGYVFYDAVLIEDTYTVTFDSQGGSPVAPYTDVASGSSIARPDNPTKTGYDISGWYTNTTFETEWNFNTAPVPDVVISDMTLYALWKTHTSTVFFNSQGGSSVEPIDGVAYGETITAPTAPTRTGYDFEGWYKESGCTTPWDFENDVVYEDTTLFAKWTIQTFSVTFDSNGGSQISPYTGVEYGSKINEPSTPEKLENNFDGWYKDSEFETAWDFANDTVTEDITLYAKWVEWSKSRIYNPNAYNGEKLKLVTASKTRETFNVRRR